MDILYTFQEALLKSVNNSFVRSLDGRINWRQRMLGIRGLRGVGKTTLLLQRLKYHLPDDSLYVTADHPWFYDNTLYDLAEMFEKNGGRVLLIDEIHKYPRWSTELKNIYDGFPALQVIFTASSALDIQRGEADLSRRTLSYSMGGLSFREYLDLFHGQKYQILTLDAVLHDAQFISRELKFNQKVLPLFRQYLRSGYFPFAMVETEGDFMIKLNQIINTVLESDLALIEDYSAGNVIKIKKLLGVLAASVPFTPNISALAAKMQMGRDTISNFLQHLKRAGIVNLIYRSTKGVSALQKPDKIFLENTNFSYALQANPDAGSLRETFLLNQLKCAGHQVMLPEKGDFLVDEKWIIEVGGPGKKLQQRSINKPIYLALDDLDVGYQNRIPLWLFGFLY